MPTYEFRCPDGHDFERFYKTISAAPSEVECPECGKVASRRLSGGGGLVFKGSGFYLTDYGKNAHRKAPPEKKAEGGGDTAGSKSDSKTESKTEAKPKEAVKAETPKEKPAAKPKKE